MLTFEVESTAFRYVEWPMQKNKDPPFTKIKGINYKF